MQYSTPATTDYSPLAASLSEVDDDTSTWRYFLRHLPVQNTLVKDYTGKPVSFQKKAFAVIPFDVGTTDLQQCADALMRLRAEYLFQENRVSEIGFHFTDGTFYTFNSYCSGKRPVMKNGSMQMRTMQTVAPTHQALRRYLDIVYMYAGTISLHRELRAAADFTIGTVVIYPGSPGHCFIITDAKTTASGERLYKLVESYIPAQSIYVLRNLQEPQLGEWHRLNKNKIETASYTFTRFSLKKFE